jgi:hypothetical protein
MKINLIKKISILSLLLLSSYFLSRPSLQEDSPITNKNSEELYSRLAEGNYEELIEERGEFSKTFRVYSSLKMLRLYTRPVHYQKENGEWEEIETAVSHLSNGHVVFAATKNSQMITDGNVRKNRSIYERYVDRDKIFLGRSGLWAYRGFLKWTTSEIPDGIDIQSIGLHLYVTGAYGGGNTVDFVQMATDVDAQSDKQLYNEIGSQTNVYESGYSGFWVLGSVSHRYINLGTKIENSLAISDLESKLANNDPFIIAVRGSNETSSLTSFASSEAPDPDYYPDLVIFYNGVEGSGAKLVRPSRNSFWDGNFYWVFFSSPDPTGDDRDIDYYYSNDGSAWTRSGELDEAQNNHHSVWYEPGGDTVWGAYKIDNDHDIKVTKGTISGTTISWDTASTALDAGSNGYDFPNIIRDTSGYCWVIARHYVNNANGGVKIARSSTTDCTSWDSPTDLVADKTLTNFVDLGGYAVPLTGGKVYTVYKDEDALYGKLYDGSWGGEETIDSTTATGVYHQGMSVVAINDVVHLVYIDASGDLVYLSRDGSWGSAEILEQGTFYGPSLSWETTTNDLYLIYQTDSGQSANGYVYSKKGQSPYGASDWLVPVVLTSEGWFPQTLGSSSNYYGLYSNYSGSERIFAFWVEGIYGLEFGSVLTPGLTPTPTMSPTATPTTTPTPTSGPSPTPTSTPTSTLTPTPTSEPTPTSTPTSTLTPTPTSEPTPTPTPIPGSVMHVENIEMTTESRNVFFTRALAEVTIYDEAGLPVDGVTVEGKWSGLAKGSDSEVTGPDGKVTLYSNWKRNASGTFTFTVNDVAKTDWTYDPGANLETEDSINV